MKKQSIYTTICLVLSSVVGAGFVGGKEVEKYFQGNVWGVIVFSAMLLFALTCLVLLCKSYNIDSINSLSKLLFGRLSLAYLWVTSLALLCIVIALFGTANDCFNAVFDVKTNYPVGQLATALICFPLVKHGKKAIEKAAKFLLPICVVFIICAWISKDKTTITSTGFSLLNITIYTFFNFVPMVSVFAKNKACNISILSGIVCLALVTLLQVANVAESQSALPTLDCVSNSKLLTTWGHVAIYLSGIVSIVVCTTAVCDFCTKVICDRPTFVGVVLATGVALSNFGFDKTVAICYPLIALLGLTTFVSVLCRLLFGKRIGERARFTPALSKEKK